MNRFGLKFHHLGLAVRKPESAFAYLRALDYAEGRKVCDPLQRVNLAMYHHEEMPDVEVIWPGDGPSPIDSMLKRWDGRVYHLCYETDNVAAAIAAMQEAGLEVDRVAAPEPAVLFGGLAVSFYSIARVGLIELIDLASAKATGSAVETKASIP